MVFVQTMLIAADNSGAQFVRCIHCYCKTKVCNPVDDVLVSVVTYLPYKEVKKGNVFKGVLVRTGFWLSVYRDAAFLKFWQNAVILLNKRDLPVGSRFKGPIPQGVRKRRYVRLIALAPLAF